MKSNNPAVLNREERYALDAAKEITIARMSSADCRVTKEGGEGVADFFEAVYRKILQLAKEEVE